MSQEQTYVPQTQSIAKLPVGIRTALPSRRQSVLMEAIQ